jgi:hypothetical protein
MKHLVRRLVLTTTLKCAAYWTLPGLVCALAILLILPLSVAAQSSPPAAAQGAFPPAAPSASELAKQTQNPVASLISVPFQGNWDFGLGSRDATGTLLNVQPVMPFSLNESTNLILRIIMPVASQPAPDGNPDGERINGLGDVLMTPFFSPQKTGSIIWGVGPVLSLPVATDPSLGSEKFGLGPSFVVLVQPGKFTIGTLFNQIWSVAGAKDRSDVNTMYWQPFLNYNLRNGLAVGVSSEISTNWKADQKVTAPLLFQVSKVALLGHRPVSFTWAAGPMVASPDGGAEWRFRFQLALLYPR